MKISGRKELFISTSAGIILLFLSLLNCKKETTKMTDGENKPTISGIVLFVVGDVLNGNKKLKVGDIISENESIKTGNKSICDLQIKELDSGIVLRMKADSIFQLKTMFVDGKQVPSAIVSIGSSMVNVSKKLKNDENFRVVTPTMVAGVRGTKFDVDVSKDGSTNISVSEGKVATQLRIEEAENLPQEIQDNSVTIQAVKNSIVAKEQIISAGYKTEVTKTQTNQILKDSGLSESISQIQSNSLVKLSEEDIKAAVKSIDKNYQSTEKDNKIIEKSAQDNSSLKVEKIPTKDLDTKLKEYSELMTKSVQSNSTKRIEKMESGDLQTKLKEYNELIAVEKKKLETTESTTSALKERKEQNKEILIKRIEEITGKNFETLLLKSGNKVKGIIFLEGDQYFVITPDGQETYKEEDAEGIEL